VNSEQHFDSRHGVQVALVGAVSAAPLHDGARFGHASLQFAIPHLATSTSSGKSDIENFAHFGAAQS
jgi:hypothetical protein